MSRSYVRQKYESAVYELVIGAGPIKSRLQSAYPLTLAARGLMNDVAESTRARMDALRDSVEAFVPPNVQANTLAVALRAMSDDDAATIAANIYDISLALSRDD